MRNSFLIVIFTFVVVVGCNSGEDKDPFQQVMYRAVNKSDTATLSLHINKKRFFGHYEIVYGNGDKDSGNVRGGLKGDTLRGDFKYISYGGSWKTVPIAFLKKDDELIKGNGIIGIYLNLPCFMPGTLNYSNSEFIFKKLEASR